MIKTRLHTLSTVVISLCALALSGTTSADTVKVHLGGWQEVPPVATHAAGSGTITVADDHSISGSVTTTGMTGTMAHIHNARSRESGPVIIPLTQTGKNVWSVPPGTKLTDAQYTAYKSGELYVNVHSDEHQGGEIRAQILP